MPRSPNTSAKSRYDRAVPRTRGMPCASKNATGLRRMSTKIAAHTTMAIGVDSTPDTYPAAAMMSTMPIMDQT